MINYIEHEKYNDLVKQWELEKKAEGFARTRRLAIENALLAIVSPELKDAGTNNFPGGLKIMTGFNLTCKQEEVSMLWETYRNDGLDSIKDFPFRIKWQPDAPMLNSIRNEHPDVFNSVFTNIIEIKPTKPTFILKKGE